MNKLNKWCADKIGIPENSHLYLSFNLRDANDRELVREHFQLTTDIRSDGSRYCFPRMNIDNAIAWMGNGETIEEAETDCIQAIHDSEVNSDG